MTQEDTSAPEPTTEAPVATEDATTEAVPAAEPDVEWTVIEKALDKVPADQLRKHKRFAGILGGTLQQARVEWERSTAAERERQAREAAHRELTDLAQNDPIAFSEKWLGQDATDRMRRELDTMRADTARQYMHQIGTTFGREFELTEDDVAEIAQAVVGKSNDEVLPAFNVAAARIISQREARKAFDSWRTKELAKEREALRQEVAAEMMKGEPSPSIRRSTPPSTVKPHQLADKDFDAWYEENVLKRARSFRG
jgi:hypothetical protein